LHEIFTNTFHQHEIILYKNNTPTDPDSTPTVKVYNADTDVLIESGSGVATGVTGEFYYQITPSLSSVDRVLRIEWDYSFNSYPVKDNSYAGIVTPYATLSDIIYELSLGKSSADENYIEPEQILFAERLARIQINNYTMQTFSKRDDEQTMYGIGNDSLFLTEKMLSISSIYEDEFLVYQKTPYYNVLSDYDLTLSDTGKTILISNPPNESVNRAFDPFGTTSKNRFVNGKRYTVKGIIGWQNVPQDIRAATVMLAGDILSRDYQWRNKYLSKVNLSEIAFDINSAAFVGTGNAIVDSILDSYKNVGIVII
jgi:hypothetical protein